jgi:hypothetical protein
MRLRNQVSGLHLATGTGDSHARAAPLAFARRLPSSRDLSNDWTPPDDFRQWVIE